MFIKTMAVTVLTVLAFIQTSAHAANGTWGVKELLVASEAATMALKSALGSEAYEGIKGISIELNAQKIAAKAKISYAVGGGSTQTASYFCHEHDEDIDCH